MLPFDFKITLYELIKNGHFTGGIVFNGFPLVVHDADISHVPFFGFTA